MGVRVAPVDLSGLNTNKLAKFDLGNPVEISQIIRDWHIWLKDLVIEQAENSESVSAMALLLRDAWEQKKSNKAKVLRDPTLLAFASELQQIEQKLADLKETLEKADGDSPSDEQMKQLQQQSALEQEKKELLKGAKGSAREAFEEKHLSIDVLQQFWRQYLIPEAHRSDEGKVQQYIDFFTRYAHQGGILNAYIMGLQEYAAKQYGYFRNTDVQFVITVSNSNLLIKAIYRIKDMMMFNKENQCLYVFEPQEGIDPSIELISQVTVGIGSQQTVEVITHTGFETDIATQLRRQYVLTVYNAEKKITPTETGGILEGYLPVDTQYFESAVEDKRWCRPPVEVEEGRVVESISEKETIIRRLLMWLENLIQQIQAMFNKILVKSPDASESSLEEQEQPLLS